MTGDNFTRRAVGVTRVRMAGEDGEEGGTLCSAVRHRRAWSRQSAAVRATLTRTPAAAATATGTRSDQAAATKARRLGWLQGARQEAVEAVE
jgi:hypothetical protein